MGTMYDAVDVAAIPAGAQIVAGYVDGNWPTYTEVVKAFPNAQTVSITVKGAPGARVADCESGDLTPQSAAGWAKAEIAAGRRPTIYYSRANAAAVSAALQNTGVAISEVDFWVADWTGSEHLVAGSVATQWADPPSSGGNYDISETVESWPTVPTPEPGPVPNPAPAPAPPYDEEPGGLMVVYDSEDGLRHVFTVNEDTGLVTHWWQIIKPGAGQTSAWNRETLPQS
jgi:hypothetical protein